MRIAMRELKGMELQEKDFNGKWLDEMKRMIRERGLNENTTKYRITYKKDGKWYLIPAGRSDISISVREFIRTHGVMWEMIDKVRGAVKKSGAKEILFYDSSKKPRGRKKFVSRRDNYLEIKSWVGSGNFIKLPQGLSQDLNTIINYFGKGASKQAGYMEDLLKNLENSGEKAGRAATNRDWSFVDEQKRYMNKMLPLLEAKGMDRAKARKIWDEAYKRGR